MSAQPGWYDQPDGSQRYWDGRAWTENTRAPNPTMAPPPLPGSAPAVQAAGAGAPFYRNRVVIGVAAVVVLLAGFSAMKSGGSQPQASPELVPVVTATATVTVAAPGPAISTTSDPTEAATSEALTEADEDDEPAEAETFKMPKVVEMNLQDAQDKLQAMGSWLMDQEDASGLDRFQMLDSNWKVCSQKPKAGKVVPVDTVVVLKSVKLLEGCP